jgi:hypothetical protein
MKLLLVTTLLCAPALAYAGEDASPDGFRDFAALFRAAHDSSDIGKISELICWNAVDAQTRASVERHTASEFGRPISSISFEGLPEDENLEYQQGGVTYRPNLSPIGYLVVRYVANPSNPTAATATRYLLGRKAGMLRIATAAPFVGQ